MGNNNSTNNPIERYDLSKTPKAIFGLKTDPDSDYSKDTKMTCSDLSMFNSRYRKYVNDTKEAYDNSTESKEFLDRYIRDETETMFNEEFDMGRRNSNEGATDSTKENVGADIKDWCILGSNKGKACTSNSDCYTGEISSGVVYCTSQISGDDPRKKAAKQKKGKERQMKKYNVNEESSVNDLQKASLGDISDRPPSYNNDKLEVLAMFDLCNRAKDASGNCLATVDEVEWGYTGGDAAGQKSTHIITGGFRCVVDGTIAVPEPWGDAGSPTTPSS